MYRYRLDLSYNGTSFNGWQTQPDGGSVQDHIEAAVSRIIGPTKILGASRTDSGVHAEHQVAVFDSSKELDTFKSLKGFNALLSKDIRICKLSRVASDFHPILHAKSKLYRYRLWLKHCESPFAAPFSWTVPNVDIDLMRKAAGEFVGHHNFKSFCASDTNAKTFDRHILEITFDVRDSWTDVYILGEGFLKQMVRNIVGTLVEIGLGRMERASLPGIIAAQDRRRAGRTAPAKGLSLVEIYYEQNPTSIRAALNEESLFSFSICE